MSKAITTILRRMDYSSYRNSIKYFSYDTELYPLYTMIQNVYGTTAPLEYLHQEHIVDPFEQVTFENDTKTDYHRMYYKSPMYKDVIAMYHSFIRDNVSPLFQEDIVVQKEPSFRIGVPNNTVLGKLQTDEEEIIGMHCDGDYNHPPQEINFMVSITGQEGTNSCYVESAPMKGDFAPLTIDKGQFVSFYGNRCRHYNKVNRTGRTRISFDFRVIPLSEYKETEGTAVHSNRKFVIGDYFRLFPKE
jgi:hypothetical protein